ncbi:MAG: STAS/SEC14 domain-containing protein [Caldilineaceae bacterium]|nr:STAS/SEC14 domain-containing protein [Caldilineaceae bacterium]
MIYKMHQSAGDILGFHISGKLTDEDYKDVFVPELEKAITQAGSISLLLELEDFQGWDAHAMWDDLKVGLKYRNALTRIAVAGDRRWEEWMAKLLKYFTKAEVKYFEHARDHRAWIWLQEREGAKI